MPASVQRTPEYDRPPVVEVVCGVLFRNLRQVLAPHTGDLWQRFRAQFPKCIEQPLIAPAVETFDEPMRATLQLSDLPPIPRLWFLTEREDRLVQFQRDRFLFNWKRVDPVDEYPHFREVFASFQQHFGVLAEFLRQSTLGEVEPQQFELTYVNHIDPAVVAGDVDGLGGLFPDLAWRADQPRFLRPPEDSTWRISFVLPNRAGRLHATVRTLVDAETARPLIRFELTARGIGAEKTVAAMPTWFEMAHGWIVGGFADLTHLRVQQTAWGRRDV